MKKLVSLMTTAYNRFINHFTMSNPLQHNLTRYNESLLNGYKIIDAFGKFMLAQNTTGNPGLITFTIIKSDQFEVVVRKDEYLFELVPDQSAKSGKINVYHRKSQVNPQSNNWIIYPCFFGYDVHGFFTNNGGVVESTDVNTIIGNTLLPHA